MVARVVEWYKKIFMDMWPVALSCTIFLSVGLILDYLGVVHPR
jgi:hypothetical protein